MKDRELLLKHIKECGTYIVTDDIANFAIDILKELKGKSLKDISSILTIVQRIANENAVY